MNRQCPLTNVMSLSNILISANISQLQIHIEYLSTSVRLPGYVSSQKRDLFYIEERHVSDKAR